MGNEVGHAHIDFVAYAGDHGLAAQGYGSADCGIVKGKQIGPGASAPYDDDDIHKGMSLQGFDARHHLRHSVFALHVGVEEEN